MLAFLCACLCFLHFCIDVPLQRWLFVRGVMGLRMAWVEAWMRGCMLIVSGRGQVLVLDEPERHLAGECRRDEWAVSVVSAVYPSFAVCMVPNDVCRFVTGCYTTPV